STLVEHRQYVRVSISLLSGQRDIERVVEPLAPSLPKRLTQIGEFRRMGIAVEVNLDPLLPGLTDTRDSLWPLLDRLAHWGIERVGAGYLVLRPGVRDRLRQALEPAGWSELVLANYADGPLLHDGANPPAQYLSKSKRQRGYAGLVSLAANFGLMVQISGL